MRLRRHREEDWTFFAYGFALRPRYRFEVLKEMRIQEREGQVCNNNNSDVSFRERDNPETRKEFYPCCKNPIRLAAKVLLAGKADVSSSNTPKEGTGRHPGVCFFD
jgi:hypothetical protein